MKYKAVVLDSDYMVTVALVAMLKKISPEIEVTPLNSLLELSAVAHTTRQPFDLLISNVKVENESGADLHRRISAVSAKAELYFHEGLGSDPDSMNLASMKGFHLLSLDAPLSIWSHTVRQLLGKA